MLPDTIPSMQAGALLQQSRKLRRQLSETRDLREIKIAVLGGVTTNEVVSLLEILLLAQGFRPVFWQSEYGRYFEDAVLEPQALIDFAPELVYIHTHLANIRHWPGPGATADEARAALDAELGRLRAIWDSIGANLGCHIIQNNVETPPLSLFGNADAVADGGRVRFIWELNAELSRASAANRKLTINDLNTLSGSVGYANWHSPTRWFSYKIPTTPEGSLAIAKSLAATIGAILGKSKKVLVLDLDNTLWGGVIGDDGVDKIQLGNETPVAEAYTAFQRYCLDLRSRGVLLAVCSKNNLETAVTGFSHPDSVLKLDHFSAFKANWDPKPKNIEEMAAELSLGLDSFVFVDDNPAERALVRAQLPMVLTPEVGDDVTRYASIISATRCFELVRLSDEDLKRAEAYAANAVRVAQQARFTDYGEYLDSLQMRAEIDVFQPVYLDRITQLVNKSNQFNLTTRRYTNAEIENIANSPAHLPLFVRLTDCFGDNGLISVLIGREEGDALHLDLWLMSCRVLKREVELALLDAVVDRAQARGLRRLIGYFSLTPKNRMVRDHYLNLGFTQLSSNEDGSVTQWELPCAGYAKRNTHIAVSACVTMATT